MLAEASSCGAPERPVLKYWPKCDGAWGGNAAEGVLFSNK